MSCIADNQTEGDVQPNPQSDSQSDVNMVKTEAGASAGDQQQTGDQVKMEEDGEESEDEDALLGDGEEKMEADMEEKLKIEGDHDDEEHKDEGPKVGKTWEKIGELKDGVQEKLKEILPAAFKSGKFSFSGKIIYVAEQFAFVTPFGHNTEQLIDMQLCPYFQDPSLSVHIVIS